jgi:hypothetical protein
MTHRLRAPALTLLALFLAVSLMPTSAFAAVTVGAATGGTTLTVGTFADLTGPSLTEVAVNDISTGTIDLSLPSGFQFDASAITATVTTAAGNCSGTRSLQLNNAASQTVTPAAGATAVTFTVTRAATSPCRNTITWSGVRVRATTAAAGDLVVGTGSTSTITGLTKGTTSLGALSTPASITSFTPDNSPAGTTVTVTGSNFTGTTAVTFNGTNARSFSVVSNTQITAIVPSSAGAGTIAVTTPANTATSPTSYTPSTVTWNAYDSTPTGSCATASTVATTFMGASQSVCAKGSGFAPSTSYSVAFYDAGGTARFSEVLSSDASGNLSTASNALYNNIYAPGTWNVVAFQTGTLPGGAYSAAAASATNSADDSFGVDGTAVPGLPTPLAALVASLGAGGFYYLARRRALPVRA